MTTVQERPTAPAGRATIEDLYHVEGKAELINGVIVKMAATGEDPGYAGEKVFISLFSHAAEKRVGRAAADGRGFRVNLPHRESFSPDAAYYVAQRAGMRFVEGAPLFAVEVRSEGDYGPAAEGAMADKRADYFAAGTLVVWDVDLLDPEAVCASTGPVTPAAPPATAGARPPRPNPPCRAGPCRGRPVHPGQFGRGRLAHSVETRSRGYNGRVCVRNTAMQLLTRWLASAVALFITVKVGQALHIEKFWVAPGLAGAEGLLLTSVVLGVVNAVLRPLLRMLTLPLTCLTFGLSAFVVNAVLFWLAGQVAPAKFHVAGWEAPLFGSVVMGLLSGLINLLVVGGREKKRI